MGNSRLEEILATRQAGLEKLRMNLSKKEDNTWLPSIKSRLIETGKGSTMEGNLVQSKNATQSRGFQFDAGWLTQLGHEVGYMAKDSNYQPEIIVPLSLGDSSIRPEELEALVAGLELFCMPYTLYIDAHEKQSDVDQFYIKNKEMLERLGAVEKDFQINPPSTLEKPEQLEEIQKKEEAQIKGEIEALNGKKVVLLDNLRLSQLYEKATGKFHAFIKLRNKGNITHSQIIEAGIATAIGDQKKRGGVWKDYPIDKMHDHMEATVIDLIAFELIAKQKSRKTFLFYPYPQPAFFKYVHEKCLNGDTAKVVIQYKGFTYPIKSKKENTKTKTKKKENAIKENTVSMSEGSKLALIKAQFDLASAAQFVKTQMSEESKLVLIGLQFELESAAQFVKSVGITDGKALGDFFNATRENREKQINAFLACLEAEDKVSEFYDQIMPASSTQSFEFDGGPAGSSSNIEKIDLGSGKKSSSFAFFQKASTSEAVEGLTGGNSNIDMSNEDLKIKKIH